MNLFDWPLKNEETDKGLRSTSVLNGSSRLRAVTTYDDSTNGLSAVVLRLPRSSRSCAGIGPQSNSRENTRYAIVSQFGIYVCVANRVHSLHVILRAILDLLSLTFAAASPPYVHRYVNNH